MLLWQYLKITFESKGAVSLETQFSPVAVHWYPSLHLQNFVSKAV